MKDVYDPVLNTNVSFSDAVRRGIIDRETGNYIDRRTKESMHVAEAIQRNLLDAKLIEGDGSEELGLNIDRSSAVVVQCRDKIRRNVMKKLRVLSAFKAAIAKKQENS